MQIDNVLHKSFYWCISALIMAGIGIPVEASANSGNAQLRHPLAEAGTSHKEPRNKMSNHRRQRIKQDVMEYNVNQLMKQSKRYNSAIRHLNDDNMRLSMLKMKASDLKNRIKKHPRNKSLKYRYNTLVSKADSKARSKKALTKRIKALRQRMSKLRVHEHRNIKYQPKIKRSVAKRAHKAHKKRTKKILKHTDKRKHLSLHQRAVERKIRSTKVGNKLINMLDKHERQLNMMLKHHQTRGLNRMLNTVHQDKLRIAHNDYQVNHHGRSPKSSSHIII